MSRSLGRTLVATMLVALLYVSGHPAVRADTVCGSPGSRRVPILARAVAGSTFTQIGADGESPYLDLDSGTTMVPVRSLVSVISANDGDIRWDASTRTATFIRSGLSVSFSFVPGSHSSDRARVNGQLVAVESLICNGRLYAPARFVTNALGVGLKWYPDGTVVIDPAWGPGGPPRSLPDLEPFQATTPAWECESVPVNLFSILRAPVTAYWQATRATACHMIQRRT